MGRILLFILGLTIILVISVLIVFRLSKKDIRQALRKLKEEGFKHVYEWRDEPHVEYPEHAHEDRVSFYIIEGSLTFRINGETIELNKGDRYDVPPKTNHTAKVGPEGCSFVVGEMIEGDS